MSLTPAGSLPADPSPGHDIADRLELLRRGRCGD